MVKRMQNDECRMQNEERPAFFVLHSAFIILSFWATSTL
jgi:hypothetical protein